MKHWIVVLGIACVLAAAAGCKRDQPQRAEPFDPALDAPATALRVPFDPRVQADQKKIAEDAVRARRGPREGDDTSSTEE